MYVCQVVYEWDCKGATVSTTPTVSVTIAGTDDQVASFAGVTWYMSASPVIPRESNSLNCTNMAMPDKNGNEQVRDMPTIL